MRIAFYAPLNAPDRGPPSGDRLIGRMLLRALAEAGHSVEIVSRFRSYDGRGERARQARLREVGLGLAGRLARRLAGGTEAERPRVWLTYHLYHKAPDWLGPTIAQALGIPYAIAEASHAGKQAGCAWALGHEAVAAALGVADLVIGLNRSDRDGVLPLLASPSRYRQLPPFIDCRPLTAARLDRDRHRGALLASAGLAGDGPLLLAVGMMRDGAKLASYRLLARALVRLEAKTWTLIVVGDGEAEGDVRAAFGPLGDRVRWLGRRTGEDLAAIYAACDLLVWPAIKEALGMVFLEAQAAGLPVVGAANLGVPDVIDEGVTGLLPAYGDADAFAAAVGTLIEDGALRRRMGAAAAGFALACHDLPTAGRAFAKALEGLDRG